MRSGLPAALEGRKLDRQRPASGKCRLKYARNRKAMRFNRHIAQGFSMSVERSIVQRLFMALILGLASIAFCSGTYAQALPNRLNVLFIAVDDLSGETERRRPAWATASA
jgi:hypothetical protein